MLIERVEQQFAHLLVENCDPVVQCTQTLRFDTVAGSDELAAALKSRAAQCELSNDVRRRVHVVLSDKQPIREPQEERRTKRMRAEFDARELLEPVAAQPVDAQNLVGGSHRHERVAAARRGESPVLIGLDALEQHNARAAFDSEQIQTPRVPLADQNSRVAQSANHVGFVVPVAVRLAPRVRLLVFGARERHERRTALVASAHEQRVRVAQVAHTEY